MSWWDSASGIPGAIASTIGSGLEFWGQERANRQNKDIWKKTQDWTEMMSNTAWQRGVKDMRAAGINPMVAFSQGGASSPSGAIGTPMRSPTAGMSNSATAASRAFNEQQLMAKQADKLVADTALSKAQTGVAHEQKKLTANSARKVAEDTVATEGSLKHALGSVWEAMKPSNISKLFSKPAHSAKAASLSNFHD